VLVGVFVGVIVAVGVGVGSIQGNEPKIQPLRISYVNVPIHWV
jgi:hypothetical protein